MYAVRNLPTVKHINMLLYINKSKKKTQTNSFHFHWNDYRTPEITITNRVVLFLHGIYRIS